MARIQKNRLSLEHLTSRREFLEEQLAEEKDVMKRLDLTQAIIDTQDAIKNILNKSRERIR